MDLLGAAQFTEGFLAGYAVLESVDKFQLIKNKKNLTLPALKKKAWKHTKYNLLGGLAAGVASVLAGKYITNKYTLPINEKIADWADKQQRIHEKAKELVEQENNTILKKTSESEQPAEKPVEEISK